MQPMNHRKGTYRAYKPPIVVVLPYIGFVHMRDKTFITGCLWSVSMIAMVVGVLPYINLRRAHLVPHSTAATAAGVYMYLSCPCHTCE